MANLKDKTLLSIIVPIGPSLSNEANLVKWLLGITTHEVAVFLIYDSTPPHTRKLITGKITNIPKGKITIFESGLNSPGATRNIGLNLVKTEWVAFWDADDLGDVKEALVAISEASQSDEVIVGSFSICENTTSGCQIVRFKNIQDYETNILDVAFNPGLWRMIFKVSGVKKNSFPNWKMAEDQAFLFTNEFPMRSIYFTNRNWYCYFLNVAGQATRSPQSIRQLRVSTSWFGTEINLANDGFFDFGILLLMRQILSSIRHGRFIDKFVITLKFISLFLQLNVKKKQRVFSMMSKIIERSL